MTTKTSPGRPRSDTSKQALIQATFDMLREFGYERLSMDGIAARAGVGKTTIYRWYKTKDDLLIEALVSCAQKPVEIPDTGKLSTDLQALLQDRLNNDPLCFNRQSLARTTSALAGSPELAQTYWDEYVSKKRESTAIVFERAKQRGEMATDADTELFLDLLYGYILVSILIRPKGTLSVKGVAKAVETLLTGFAPTS